MQHQKSVESLWERLQRSLASSSVRRLRPASPLHVRFCLKPQAVPIDDSSASPPRRKCATQRRLRSFELREAPYSYGIPSEKYSALLLADRKHQAHILDNEFRLLADKLKTCTQSLEGRKKAQVGLLDAAEQRNFNSKIEKAIAWVEEVVQMVAKRHPRLRHAGKQRPVLPAAEHVSSEPDAYEDNVRLLLASSTAFSTLFSEYTRLARSDQHQCLSVERCLAVLKRVSQVRLCLNYLQEAISAHEEAIRFDRRMLKSVSGFTDLGRLMKDKLKAFRDANIDVSAPAAKPASRASMSTKEFALHLIEQKRSARSPGSQRAETMRPEQHCDTERYSNVSNLFLESQLKKSASLRRPTAKFRLRMSRADSVLARAEHSSNPLVANSVRQLMALRSGV